MSNTPEANRSRFDPTPEEAALDMSVEPEAPEYDDVIRPDWTPPGMSDEEIARYIYIPKNRRRPGVPYLGPEID